MRHVSPWAAALAGAVILGLLPAACGGPARTADGARVPTVVAGTSMLQAAVEAIPDLHGRIQVTILVSPGSCPGHFDLRVDQLASLRRAAAILYPDYQEGLGRKLGAMPELEGRLLRISTPESPLVPSGFAKLVEEVAAGLESVDPGWKGRLLSSLAPTRHRLEALSRELRKRSRGLQGLPVVASRHQESFCRWLGLRVVAELPRNGDTAPAGLVAALDGRARLVVADLQEGTAAAEAVGERLGVPVVVLSAFPGVPGYGSAYEELLQNNLRRLEGPWQRSESPSRR